MSSISPITVVLYLGGIQLLAHQWAAFHKQFCVSVAAMPPAVRVSTVAVFEHLLAISQATGTPDPAASAWKVTEGILLAWIARYHATKDQANPVIADFAADHQRIKDALYQVLLAEGLQVRPGLN